MKCNTYYVWKFPSNVRNNAIFSYIGTIVLVDQSAAVLVQGIEPIQYK